MARHTGRPGISRKTDSAASPLHSNLSSVRVHALLSQLQAQLMRLAGDAPSARMQGSDCWQEAEHQDCARYSAPA